MNLKRHILPPLLLASLLAAALCPGAEPLQRNPFSEPVYRIPLCVHLGGSSRPPDQWVPILEEINTIWLSQAGICFEIRTVSHDEKSATGFDLWFEPTLPEWNGYFCDAHDIHVRDNPDLKPAQRAARSSAARTAAHELGHALALSHRQDSDDNLMRSKTYGWQLHAGEVATARRSAQQFALPDSAPRRCAPVTP